ncbi:MAG: bifunctional aspartate kinase/homoserine dehydrogenase I [Flavobacteriaceae bacterium]|nr:bifunctional aspartate kinase/homoserine dehydrogenase I [Flavobacteriaceae bacterium]
MKVLKFGGTSVANADNIQKVIEILTLEVQKDTLVVVVSALGGVTDMLQKTGELANTKDQSYLTLFKTITSRHIDTARTLGVSKKAMAPLEALLKDLEKILQGVYLINEFSNKTKDKVLSFGELLSSFIISEALKNQVNSVVLKDSRDLIVTNSNFTQAQPYPEITAENIHDYFQKNPNKITVLPGFVARNKEGETTTLGRGGSDYTAAILAGNIKADVLEIWTDVSGMYTANPKIVQQAFPIEEISYEEAMELSHFGAKVLYPPTIRPVLENGIPIHIKNTFAPHEKGTLVSRTLQRENGPVKGISHLPNIALLTLEGTAILGTPGFSKRMFEALSEKAINVILITQASSEHSICVAIQEKEARIAEKAINLAFAYEISLGKIHPVSVEKGMAIIALVGDKMKSHQGISGKMFSSLGKNNVNIRAIAQGASEKNISTVIDEKDVHKALNTLHYRFFEKQVKILNLYIVGVGNVGARLLSQLQKQQKHLYEHLFLKVNVVGISNSRKMAFKSSGINLKNWEEALQQGDDKTHEAWFERIKKMNLLNSVFVDITADANIANSYAQYLKESIAVIACNKIACSSQYDSYQNLKDYSRKYNAPFLFETNVGAGLPIINTLNNLINSGDSVTKIQAVLSGSLNFVFNNFNEDNTFYNVVLQAQKEGYTEPDPRIDLSGVDVARKILILARESGYSLDMEDVENVSFLPKKSLKAKMVPEFLETLKTEAQHFEAMYKKATLKKCRLKYVAEFDQGKAKVSLMEIPEAHPFFHLEGKDNIVLFYTERYAVQPLIIKGAGAGAEVTASGLFGDIIRLGKN